MFNCFTNGDDGEIFKRASHVRHIKILIAYILPHTRRIIITDRKIAFIMRNIVSHRAALLPGKLESGI